MRPELAFLAFRARLVAAAVAGAAAGAGCSGPAAQRPGAGGSDVLPRGELAEEDAYAPSYGKAELQRALIAERGAEATGERVVAELEQTSPDSDRLRVARADLAVRRRFIGSLEACEASGRACPPRLDDPPWAFDPDPDVATPPPLDAPLRFDLESWRVVAAELHGRACACRTIACVDSVGVAIDQLEPRPMREVQGDEVASQSLTWARACLFRLRGRATIRDAASRGRATNDDDLHVLRGSGGRGGPVRHLSRQARPDAGKRRPEARAVREV